MNKGSYSTTVNNFTAGSRTVNLTLGAQLPEGAHSLEVTGGQDYSNGEGGTGFGVNKTELPFTFTVDTTTPVASISKATETEVTLKFTKPVKATDLNTDVTAYHTLNNSANYKGVISAVEANADGYTDTYKVTFSTPIPQGAGKVLYLNTKENKLEDTWGNDVVSGTLSFNLVSDVTAPRVLKVEATGKNATAQKELTVTFDEEVVGADAQNKANYVLKDASGNVVKTASFADVDNNGKFNTNASINYNNSKKQAVISFTNALPAGSYTLEVSNVRDTSFNSNKLTSQTVQFSVVDTIAPTVAAISHTTPNVLYVNFSEAMNTTDLLAVGNYGLLVNTTPRALPAGSTVEVVNSQKVKITIPTSSAPTAGATVGVQVSGSVKDAAGNAIGGLFGTATNTVEWGTASTFTIVPDTDQVKLVASNRLEFEVNTELSAVDASKFSIAGATDASGIAVGIASVTYVNNAGKAKVTVTLDKNLASTDVDFDSLDIAAAGLTNAEGLALTGTPSFEVAEGHIEDKLAAKILEVKTTATNQITVTFSEGIPAGEISNATFTVAGNTVSSVAHTADSDTLVITLGSHIDTDAKPRLTQVIDIKDSAGNVLAAGTSVLATVDGIAAVATASFSATNAKVVTINFNETMTASTLVQANFSSVAGEAITAFTKAADNKSVTITFTEDLAADDEVVVSAAVTDAAGNASGTTLTK